ncbi:MAG: hypothetical protein JXB04_03660 [Kiritimatiellae bacterium]|nr:hypothetical protein [Kiritimatiellia bacterium]
MKGQRSPISARAAILAALLALALLPGALWAASRPIGEDSYYVLRIADFEDREERNDFDGGYFGIWSKDPDDATQGCRMTFAEEGQGFGYYCIKLEYDVDSPNPAYNGFWLLFVDVDLSAYDRVCFWARGDAVAGFTERFVVEMKNEEEAGRATVKRLTDEWQLIEIPLKDFTGVTDWRAMTELVIVFEDRVVTRKLGTIYIDNLYFARGKADRTLDMADPRMTVEEVLRATSPTHEALPTRAGPTHPGQ